MTTSEASTSWENTNLAQELLSAGFRKTSIAEAVSTFVGSFLHNEPSSMSVIRALQKKSNQVNTLVPRIGIDATNDSQHKEEPKVANGEKNKL